MDYTVKQVTIDDYDAMLALWNSAEQSRRALNPVDDSREGIDRYLRRNPNTCFSAVSDGRLIGVILAGHDGRRAIIHHLCVHPDCRRMGVAARLVSAAEAALLNKPVYFFVPDTERYAAECGINLNPLEVFPDVSFASPEELVSAVLGEKATSDNISEVKELLCGGCDGHSTENIIKRALTQGD